MWICKSYYATGNKKYKKDQVRRNYSRTARKSRSFSAKQKIRGLSHASRGYVMVQSERQETWLRLLLLQSERMGTMKETDLQNLIRIELSKHGIVIRQNTGNFIPKDGRRVKCGVAGLSDLLFIGDGYVAFIEVKTPKGRPTPEQINFIHVVREHGHRAGIVRSVQDALRLIGVGV